MTLRVLDLSNNSIIAIEGTCILFAAKYCYVNEYMKDHIFELQRKI